MSIPTYILTGFLDSGKTTFLNQLLNKPDWQEVKVLILQFETGEESLEVKQPHWDSLKFQKKLLEQQPEQIVAQIEAYLSTHQPEEVWIEWNGMVPFSQLQDLLLQASLGRSFKIQKVVHFTDGEKLESLLGKTGNAMPEQIASCDLAIVRNAGSAHTFNRIRRLLAGINPGVKVYDLTDEQKLYKGLFRQKEHPAYDFLFPLALSFLLLLFGKPLLERFQVPVNTIINLFLGIILQAFPFLLVGVLLSSAIQVFVPQRFIEDNFPKSPGLGMLFAILGGFCLPVCDCASIPVFRSLVKKGIPLPVAVTFMAASPVINPVVIFSTYYAFNGNLQVVIGRVAFGIIAALLIGLYFAYRPPKSAVLSGGVLDRLMCSCGCYEDVASLTSFREKLSLFLRHAQTEFFDVGKFLLLGTLVATLFQVTDTGLFTSAQQGATLPLSILIMMVMAFVLSLCSSSDAVVARSFSNQFPAAAIMGFLVFGPIMDIKNVLLLSAGFSKRFIGSLLLTTFLVCFAVIYLFALLGGI